MTEDRRKIAAALAGAIAVFHHQKTRGTGGNARSQQPVDQAQTQFRPRHQSGGGDQVAIIDNRRIGLEPYRRITFGECFGRSPVGGGAATVEQTAFSQQDRAHANPAQCRAAGMLLAQPADQALWRLALGKAGNRWRDQHGHQGTLRAGMAVEDPGRRLITLDLPMADPQQGQLRSLMLGGDPVRHPEQVRQAMHRRHLRAGIDQHTELGDCPFCIHCQFSPSYCRCGQSPDRLPAPILHSTPKHTSRKQSWPSKRSS
ncbi:hypothetical protein D3C80_1048700 [compost metagenome]